MPDAMLALLARSATLYSTRSAGNPNHGSDGRFASGGSGSAAHSAPGRTYTPQVPADWQAVEHAAHGPGDGISSICARCSLLLSGPMAGTRLNFVPSNDTPTQPDVHWSHGVCTRDARRGTRSAIAYIMRRDGFSAEAQARVFRQISRVTADQVVPTALAAMAQERVAAQATTASSPEPPPTRAVRLLSARVATLQALAARTFNCNAINSDALALRVADLALRSAELVG